jgi:hypothetical protein
MQKCFYHAKTDAATMCMGCKMPICANCRDEGKKGFCENCIKKVATLGEQITDTKKTGMVQGAHKATMIKSSGRSTGPKNITYCFHHFDIVASATCPTCNRAFCPACLNSAGICSHCARHNADAQERMFAPNERGRKILEEAAAESARRYWGTKEYVIAGLVVLVLLIGWKHFHKPTAKIDTTRATLEKLHENDLSADQQAMLDKLQGQKKVDIPEPPVEAAPPVVSAAAGGVAVAGAAMAPNRAAAGGGSRAAGAGRAMQGGRVQGAAAVHVAIVSPGSGSTVHGITPVRIGLSGTPGRIDLLVDGQWSGSINSAPFRFDWASQAVSNGTHQLTLQALGEAGVLSQSNITVNVSN